MVPKVYILQLYNGEDTYILGVYDTEEKANKAMDKWKARDAELEMDYAYDTYFVEMYEVK